MSDIIPGKNKSINIINIPNVVLNSFFILSLLKNPLRYYQKGFLTVLFSIIILNY